jgi:hypothetical protein
LRRSNKTAVASGKKWPQYNLKTSRGVKQQIASASIFSRRLMKRISPFSAVVCAHKILSEEETSNAQFVQRTVSPLTSRRDEHKWQRLLFPRLGRKRKPSAD